MANVVPGDVFRVQFCVRSTSLPRNARVITAWQVMSTTGLSVPPAAACARAGFALVNLLQLHASQNVLIQGIQWSELTSTGHGSGSQNIGITILGTSPPWGYRLCSRIFLDCGLGPVRNARIFWPFTPSSDVVWGATPMLTAAGKLAIDSRMPLVIGPKNVFPVAPDNAVIQVGVWDRASLVHTVATSWATDPILRFQRRRGPWWCETAYP